MSDIRTITRQFSTVTGEEVTVTISEWGLITFNGTEWYAVPELDEWEESFYSFNGSGYWFTATTIRLIGGAIINYMWQCDRTMDDDTADNPWKD